MANKILQIIPSEPLHGIVELSGAKNAVLVTLASLILTSGKSILKNVPFSDDVMHFIVLLKDLGAEVSYDTEKNIILVDTSTLNNFTVPESMMNKMRASILVMGPLLARFGKANVAMPGGCSLGARPIDFHLKGFKRMGVEVNFNGQHLSAKTVESLRSTKYILEYPSVGATENILMAATCANGTTMIINAALEPEVLDLIGVLKKMGAKISLDAPATIYIEGVSQLHPIEHEIMPDRLEAGSLLLAAAITKGSMTLPNARANELDVFLQKLEDMGHELVIGDDGVGISIKATSHPQAVSFRTAPYPGFPTDLQAPMLAVQCLAEGVSTVHETVFENRLMHVKELQKMGAQITLECNEVAVIKGTNKLFGANVTAPDIRAGYALLLAGLVAHGKTYISGIHHLMRGYHNFDEKLRRVGADVSLGSVNEI